MKKISYRFVTLLLVLAFLFSLMPQAFAAQTTSSVMLFDQSSPNYTIELNSQIGITYHPNGTDAAVTAYLKNIGWHFARYGNVSYPDKPIYCIEPNKNFNASSSGNYMDTGVTVDGYGSTRGQSTWYAMPESYRRAITLILLYSDQMWDDAYSVNNTYRDSNPNTPLRLATQFLIYEIVTGIRDASTFNAYGNGYVDGDILYNAGVQVSNFAPNYNAIVDQVQSAMMLPSFVGSSSSSAPTIDLEEDSVLTWVHDNNGVMSNYTFTGDSNVNFNPYGNDLCIEKLGDISSSKVYTCYKSVPSPDNSTVALYYGGTSTYQVCVGLHTPSSGQLTGYFKLNAPAAAKTGMTILKQTSDGKNLGGWKFSIYLNSTCTSLLAGPYSTSDAGRLAFEGTTPGTYYIKEVGHVDPNIEAMYSCSSTNPQKIVVTSGQISTISFTNTLKPGSLTVKKVTSDGRNLQGWQFSVYSNAACTSLISGPHSTGSTGSVTVNNIPSGTVYVKETGHGTASIAAQYACASTNPQSVTITPNGTSSVTFTNNLRPGSLTIKKTTSDGKNLQGWQFSIYSNSACTSLISGPHSTGSTGSVTVNNIPSGTVYVKEVGHGTASVAAQYACASANPQSVSITPNGANSVTFTNNLRTGTLSIQKSTSNGQNLQGWQFSIFADAGCTQRLSGPHTTDTSGKLSVPNLIAGTVFVKELGHEDATIAALYTCSGNNPQQVTIQSGQTATVSFLNNLNPGSIKITKSTNIGTDLAGWKIGIYTDKACQNAISGSPFTTGADGSITVGKITPGTYYAKEMASSDPAWECDTAVKTISVAANQTTTVTFRNNLRPGQITIHKINHEGSNLSGAEFLLEWSEDGTQWQAVSKSETLQKGGCTSAGLEDGKLLSSDDGIVVYQGLHPGLQYRLTETKAPKDYQLLADYAFEGELSADENFNMEVTIVNHPIYQLPKTGSKSLIFTIAGLLACVSGLAGAILYLRRRRW